MDDDQPKKSRTVYKPPSVSETRRREKSGIRLQDDQELSDFNKGVDGVYRETQDWTGYHNGLLLRASAEQRALGHGDREDAILSILGVQPHADAGYVPSPEALARIEEYEAQEPIEAEVVPGELTLEEREARLAAREAELDRLEEQKAREADLAERERAADARAKQLAAYTPEVPQDLDDLDSLRNFRPRMTGETFTPTNAPPEIPERWANRKRMTAAQRAVAEQEGIELFGDPKDQPGAWSRLGDLERPTLPKPTPGAPTHHHQGSGEAERIARLARENYSDPDAYADAVANLVVDDEQVAAQRHAAYQKHLQDEQDAYDKRQSDAQAQVDAFMKNRGSLGL